MTVLDARDRAAGAVWGLAYGDALGEPTEFASHATLLERHGTAGPELAAGARVTDDTQMSLAVAAALDDVAPDRALVAADLEPVRARLVARFVAWRHDPYNDRAPGTTCLRAAEGLERRAPTRWLESTVAGSKGCGTVMRAPWLGVDPRLRDAVMRDRVAAVQAALTHGHQDAVAAAVATAALAAAIVAGEAAPGGLSSWLAEEAYRRSAPPGPPYDEEALGALWSAAGADSPGAYVRAGWQAVCRCAVRARDAVETLRSDPVADPCALAGEGWVADECLAVAAAIADAYADDPVAGLRRAALTGGDSDSIAAVTGALLGAAHGAAAWPSPWSTYLEKRYQAELRSRVLAYTRAAAALPC